MNAPVSSDHRADVFAMPLDKIDLADQKLFQDDTWPPYFERLRQEDPVHYQAESQFGPFWSITKYRDIVQCELAHQVLSSDAFLGGIAIVDVKPDYRYPSFIQMDPPRHDEQRKVVSPIVAPANLSNMEDLIRERTIRVLEDLPRGDAFDWVERVSIELTTMMLATLLDFPFEERRKLTYWSDVAICNINAPESPVHSEEERFEKLREMADVMYGLWAEREKQPPRFDLISMLAHGESTKNLSLMEFIGTLTLLIVGGNDTTRNSMSGGLWALHNHPDEYAKLRANPGLIPSLVPEIIRYHTPVIHMRRTAKEDFEIGGKRIGKGEKLVMWYISGNRDPEAISEPDRLIIDRKRPREHLSFGFGIHRCVGNRLAELQLRILWEELLPRYPVIEVLGPPIRLFSTLIRGIRALPVRIPA